MRSRQIFVALLCSLFAYQQVTAVVNNGQPTKVEDSSNPTSDTKTNNDSDNQQDASNVSTEKQTNRREAAAISDSYGAPLAGPLDSYLPSGTSNLNLPVPVYGSPDAPSNNIVYPAPPPDIPPPVSIQSISFVSPQISNTYGSPFPSPSFSGHAPSNLYGPPPKFSGPSRPKPVYGPPRFQYGPPGKPFPGSKFSLKPPYKYSGNFKKIPGTYGPPSGYIKDSFNFEKHNFKNYKILSHGGSFKGHSHSGGSISTQYGPPSLSIQNSISTQYGVPSPSTQYGVPSPSAQYGAPIISTGISSVQHGGSSLGLNSNVIPDLTAPAIISTQYGVPDVGHLNIGVQSVSAQYGPPNGEFIEPPKPHYGPPQPSPHPKPPHPGAPAPPTPPDIKYDGWQPIPGLVSRVPQPSYGVPSADQHIEADLSYSKDLSPPPVNNHIDVHTSSVSHGSVANIALEHSHRSPQPGASDSYSAPLNTVTGSGGIVSSSGKEVHGQQQSHSHHSNFGLSAGINHDLQTLKSVEYQLFPTGAGSGHGVSSGSFGSSISNSYLPPSVSSYSPNRPYAADHFYDKLRSSSSGKHSFGSSFSQNSFGSFNSHKSHGYKGLSLDSSGIGLIPPSGVYGVPPSGQYGTPLYQGPSTLNALKINQHKHHGHGFDSYKGSSSYLPPLLPNLSKPSGSFAPPISSLYSLPSAHSSVSFQSVNHGNSDLNINFGGATQAALSSYGVPLGTVDGSYNLPQGLSHSGKGNNLVEIDFTHPGLIIDLTKGQTHAHSSGQAISDCSLKAQGLSTGNYGVPPSNGYSASISTVNNGHAISDSYSGSSAYSGLSAGDSHGHSESSYDASSFGNSAGLFDSASLGLSTSSSHSGASSVSIQSDAGIPGPVYGAPESLLAPSALGGYQFNDVKPHETYGVPDLDGSHSQKSAVVKVNAVTEESHGKSYGKQVAASFGPSSELIQSQSIDLNNIPLKGAHGSYTLQIQSLDGRQSDISHGQVLNDGLLQSILAAIEQPKVGEKSQAIDFKKSLEKQNFVTNETLSSVVGQLADAELRHSTELVKDEIDKTQELAEADIDSQASTAVRYVLPQASTNTQEIEAKSGIEDKEEELEDATLPLVEDNGIALYFSHKQRTKKGTDEGSLTENAEDHNGHK